MRCVQNPLPKSETPVRVTLINQINLIPFYVVQLALCLWRRGYFLGSLCRINIHLVPVEKRVLPWQPMEDQYSRCACGEEGSSLAAYVGSIFMMSNADSPNDQGKK